jgi:hydroxymethylglutaryl-CoA lyase
MSATIAVAFGCPYDGRIEAAAVTELALALAEAGYDTILLGDTIGVADPARVEALVGCLVAALPHATIGAHFHDARGAGVANVVAAVRAGARMVDTALGGLGGCPFAPGAAGNVATEDVVWTLRAMGVALDARPQALTDAAHWMRERLAVELRSRTPQATRFDWERDVA